jgi:Fe-S-cluster containining protein
MPEGMLDEGSPCRSHRCVTCCIETEMPLTDNDLKAIEKLGFKREDFVVLVDDETHLKNIDRRCFFLSGDSCMIYGNRPEGCRIYPLVYDVDMHKFIFDPVCPHSKEFKVTRKDKDRLKHLIRKLERESAKRK